jgi:hypothetical protein
MTAACSNLRSPIPDFADNAFAVSDMHDDPCFTVRPSASPLKNNLPMYPWKSKYEIENPIGSPSGRRTVVARHGRRGREGVGDRGYQREGRGADPVDYRSKKFWRI